MLKLVLGVLIGSVLGMSVVLAAHVNGYTRSNGTYVQPYERSSPNGTVTDNYSYKGNVNPYTGTTGTNSYEHDATSPYFNGPDNNGNVGHDNSPPHAPDGWLNGH